MLSKTSCIAGWTCLSPPVAGAAPMRALKSSANWCFSMKCALPTWEILFLDKEGYPGSSTGTFAMGPAVRH